MGACPAQAPWSNTRVKKFVPADIDRLRLKDYCLRKKWGGDHAGILREMSFQEGDEKLQSHHDEERQAGDPGRLSKLRN
jgi:hypothetical protein